MGADLKYPISLLTRLQWAAADILFFFVVWLDPTYGYRDAAGRDKERKHA